MGAGRNRRADHRREVAPPRGRTAAWTHRRVDAPPHGRGTQPPRGRTAARTQPLRGRTAAWTQPPRGRTGVVLAVHLAMNGKVGAALSNPRVGNAVFWCIGALTAVAIGLPGWQSGALAPLGKINPLLLTAGALGACLVFAIAWLIPQVGAGPVMILLLAGQVIGGLAMSHFGWLGSPVQPVTLMKLTGVAVMIGGVLLATR